MIALEMSRSTCPRTAGIWPLQPCTTHHAHPMPACPPPYLWAHTAWLGMSCKIPRSVVPTHPCSHLYHMTILLGSLTMQGPAPLWTPSMLIILPVPSLPLHSSTTPPPASPLVPFACINPKLKLQLRPLSDSCIRGVSLLLSPCTNLIP